MALTAGTRLGVYEVSALIGEGGMGQVWQATDTQLNRQVALKILPDAFAADPDRLARFQREAQVLASLHHPNIAQIHGSEQAEGTRALVLELVEGPTLADCISKGPIPIDEALPIARQIVEALDGAHEAGVIHRDLKPANIKVREDGTVKVLDFGLAKALDATPEGDPSESPTMTAVATRAGIIMGTAAYMSPEQARGKTVDKRADIWAFGAVVFEMLTGKRPFEGRDVSEVLGGVLRLEPDWDTLSAVTPPRLLALLKRCLEKEPRERLRDIGDARAELLGAEQMPRTGMASEVATAPRARRIVSTVLTLLVGAVLASGGMWFFMPEALPQVARVTVSTAAPIDRSPYSALAISPDGTLIAYTGGEGDQRRLYVRRLGVSTATPLAGTESGRGLFFSPDGRWIAFWQDSTLKRVDVTGRPPETICEVPGAGVRGGSWGQDGTIIFGMGSAEVSGLFRVSAQGGVPQQVTQVDVAGGELAHRWPVFIPGSDKVLFEVDRAGPLTLLC